MTIDVDPATKSVQINIAGRFDAAQVLALLQELAAARAKVARDPDQPDATPWIATRAPLHASMVKRVGPDGCLAMRVPGLGWVGSTLSPRMRTQLIKLLLEQQARQPDRPPAEITPAPRPKKPA